MVLFFKPEEIYTQLGVGHLVLEATVHQTNPKGPVELKERRKENLTRGDKPILILHEKNSNKKPRNVHQPNKQLHSFPFLFNRKIRHKKHFKMTEVFSLYRFNSVEYFLQLVDNLCRQSDWKLIETSRSTIA